MRLHVAHGIKIWTRTRRSRCLYKSPYPLIYFHSVAGLLDAFLRWERPTPAEDANRNTTFESLEQWIREVNTANGQKVSTVIHLGSPAIELARFDG